MADGFVKEPAVVTRKNFNPAGMTPQAIELMKLQDGVRLHEQVKVELTRAALSTSRAAKSDFLSVHISFCRRRGAPPRAGTCPCHRPPAQRGRSLARLPLRTGKNRAKTAC